jgi:hypothetical protein
MHTPLLQFLILMVVGWVTRRQQHVIEYLLEENRVLREQLSGKRLRFTDAQRRRLAAPRIRFCAGIGNWLPRSMTAASGVVPVDLGLLVSLPDLSCAWLVTIRNGATREFEAH